MESNHNVVENATAFKEPHNRLPIFSPTKEIKDSLKAFSDLWQNCWKSSKISWRPPNISTVFLYALFLKYKKICYTLLFSGIKRFVIRLFFLGSVAYEEPYFIITGQLCFSTHRLNTYPHTYEKHFFWQIIAW